MRIPPKTQAQNNAVPTESVSFNFKKSATPTEEITFLKKDQPVPTESISFNSKGNSPRDSFEPPKVR